MRIIGGTARGVHLKSLRGMAVRPTGDKAREAFFDSIQGRLEGSVFLDCCAGTGVVGIEALSRGAAFVLFIDESPRALGLIRENLSRCRFSTGYRILKGDFRNLLIRRTLEPGRFDISYFDPPYESGLYFDFVRILAREDLVAPRGVVAVEHSKHTALPAEFSSRLKPWKTLRHGEIVIEMFIREPE